MNTIKFEVERFFFWKIVSLDLQGSNQKIKERFIIVWKMVNITRPTPLSRVRESQLNDLKWLRILLNEVKVWRTDRQTDRPTDRLTDKAGCRVACTRLKIGCSALCYRQTAAFWTSYLVASYLYNSVGVFIIPLAMIQLL